MNNKINSMESLALPQDLYWDIKMEPISPPTIELFSICEDLSENWLEDGDNFAKDFTNISDDELLLKHDDDIDFTKQLLNDEDLVIELYNLKEENFYSPSQLLDNSLDNVVTNPNQVIKVQTPIDINHFGFANSGASILTSLTPPSSPPQTVASPVTPPPQSQALQITLPTSAAEEITTLPLDINDVLQNSESEPTSPVSAHNQFGYSNWNNNPHTSDTNLTSAAVAATSGSPNYDIVFNTQIIDDILKSAANEIFEESESQSSISAPSLADYTTTDDEWSPSSSSGSCSPVQATSTESLNECSSSTKKRTRPYGRGVEDRKIRKKEQNKNAAIRYRQKKKAEMEIIQVEEQALNKRHEELKRQLAEHQREAKYLKRLIREFYKKK